MIVYWSVTAVVALLYYAGLTWLMGPLKALGVLALVVVVSAAVGYLMGTLLG